MPSTLESTVAVLSSAECYQLLGTRQFGRIGVIAGYYPLILPMNYAVDHHIVLVRARLELELDSAQHANVTFQVDDIDESTRSGWSVLIRGHAEELTADHRQPIAKRTRTRVQPWAPGDGFRWVRIIPHGILGRRIQPGKGRDWEFGTAAYI